MVQNSYYTTDSIRKEASYPAGRVRTGHAFRRSEPLSWPQQFHGRVAACGSAVIANLMKRAAMLKALTIYGAAYLLILFLSLIGECAAEKKSVSVVLADYKRLSLRSFFYFLMLVTSTSILLMLGEAFVIISKKLTGS